MSSGNSVVESYHANEAAEARADRNAERTPHMVAVTVTLTVERVVEIEAISSEAAMAIARNRISTGHIRPDLVKAFKPPRWDEVDRDVSVGIEDL